MSETIIVTTEEKLAAIVKAAVEEAVAPLRAAAIEEQSDVLDCERAGKLAGYGAGTMKKLAREKKCPAFKFDGHWRFRRSELLAWLATPR